MRRREQLFLPAQLTWMSEAAMYACYRHTSSICTLDFVSTVYKQRENFFGSLRARSVYVLHCKGGRLRCV